MFCCRLKRGTNIDVSVVSRRLVKVLEIGENLKVLMSEERMAVLTKEIDEWAAKKAEEDSVEVQQCAETVNISFMSPRAQHSCRL